MQDWSRAQKLKVAIPVLWAAVVALFSVSSSSYSGEYSLVNYAATSVQYGNASSPCDEVFDNLPKRWTVLEPGESTQEYLYGEEPECVVAASMDRSTYTSAETYDSHLYAINLTATGIALTDNGELDSPKRQLPNTDAGSSALIRSLYILMAIPGLYALWITVRFFYRYYVKHETRQ